MMTMKRLLNTGVCRLCSYILESGQLFSANPNQILSDNPASDPILPPLEHFPFFPPLRPKSHSHPTLPPLSVAACMDWERIRRRQTRAHVLRGCLSLSLLLGGSFHVGGSSCATGRQILKVAYWGSSVQRDYIRHSWILIELQQDFESKLMFKVNCVEFNSEDSEALVPFSFDWRPTWRLRRQLHVDRR